MTSAITYINASVSSGYQDQKPDITIGVADTLWEIMFKVKKVTVDKDLLPKGIRIDELLVQVNHENVCLTWKYGKNRNGNKVELVSATGLTQEISYSTGIPITQPGFFEKPKPFRFENVTLNDLCPFDTKPYNIVYMTFVGSIHSFPSTKTTFSATHLKIDTRETT